MSKSAVPKGMLQRASTFWGDDNRRLQKKEEGFKPLKKSLTFIDGASSTQAVTFSNKKSEKVSYPEVLYRRYFGFENATEDIGVMQIPPIIQKRNRAL